MLARIGTDRFHFYCLIFVAITYYKEGQLFGANRPKIDNSHKSRVNGLNCREYHFLYQVQFPGQFWLIGTVKSDQKLFCEKNFVFWITFLCLFLWLSTLWSHLGGNDHISDMLTFLECKTNFEHFQNSKTI